MQPLHAALHKNLEELESRLREANPSKREDTASKIDFLKVLLATEMEAHAGRALPPHILHLSGRLRTVERALRDWEDSDVPPADGLRDALTCPCTHKCCDAADPETEREEEGDGGGDGGVPEPEDLGTLVEEKVVGLATEWDKNSAKGEKKETENDRRRFRCRFISAAAAVVVGVLAICFYRVDEEVFLVPT